MKNILACALRLIVLSLASFVAQAVCVDSQAFGDLKIHIASVRQVLLTRNWRIHKSVFSEDDSPSRFSTNSLIFRKGKEGRGIRPIDVPLN
jgi:hypothetical protein